MSTGFRFYTVSVATFVVFILFVTLAKADPYRVGLPKLRTNPVAIDVVTNIYQNIGIEPVFVGYQDPISLQMANDGVLDAEMARVIDVEAENPNLIRIQIPLLIMQMDLLGLKPDALSGIEDWSDLADKKVGYVVGRVQIKNRVGTSWPNFTYYANNDLLYKALLNKEIEYGILSQFSVRRMIKQHPDVYMRKQPIDTIKLYHYIHKKNEALVLPFTKALNDYRLSF